MMITNKWDIQYLHEGDDISSKQISHFKLTHRDYDEFYDKDNKVKFSIKYVGIVKVHNDVLFSMPKHFRRSNNSENDIIMVLKSIMNYNHNKQSNEPDSFLRTTYPFEQFFYIYEYYKKYGLYYEENQHSYNNNGNTISWKTTIRSSKTFISDGNIIFSKMFYKTKMKKRNFITECMQFTIDYTIFNYGDLLNIRFDELSINSLNMNLIKDCSLTIGRLMKCMQYLFKDSEKILVHELIVFFKGFSKGSKDKFEFKHYSYNLIWENMINKYLNNYFIEVNMSDETLSFGVNNLGTNRFRKYQFAYNLCDINATLIPDHYFFDTERNIQYVFDSKYYGNLNKLDNKQLNYMLLLQNKSKYIYGSLFVPSENDEETEKYFELKSELLPVKNKRVVIFKKKLDCRKIISNFNGDYI